jgi:hypothetical protein
MGFAYTAVADHPDSVFYNVAGLSSLTEPGLAYNRQPWTADPEADGLAVALPWHGGAWGAGFNRASHEPGGASDSDAHFGAALGGPGASLGAGLRDDTVPGPKSADIQLLAADLGALWAPGAGSLRLGASILDLPLRPNPQAVPQQFALGAAWSSGGRVFSLDAKHAGTDSSLQAGAEVPVEGLCLLRLGLSSQGYQGAAVGLSGGLGLHYGRDLSLDYAALPAGSLGILHCLSLGLSFGGGLGDFFDPATQAARAQRAQEERLRVEREAASRQKGKELAVLEEGDFSLESNVVDRKVALSWPALVDDQGEPLRYEVYMGLLPEAKFREVSEGPLAAPAWAGDMGLRGVTYYFRVAALLPDGSPGPLSRVKAVAIP